GKTKLAATLSDVKTFYNQLVIAGTEKQGQLGNTSDEVAAALAVAMEALYGILGACLQHYAGNPEIIDIFDLATIRNHEQLVYTGILQPKENESILEHTFVADDQLTLSSSGSTILNYYLAANTNAPLNGGAIITVNSQDSKTIRASELGDLSNRYLH